MARKKKQDEVLAGLLAAAPPQLLTELILMLATEPAVRADSLAYLEKHAPLSSEQKRSSAGEGVMSLWAELLPELDEHDRYGGGDYDAGDRLSGQLCQIEKKLTGGKIGADYRRRLLDQLLPFIASANAGLDDDLYRVAHAACYDDADLLKLAQAFEGMGCDWPLGHARRIYRQLGQREKYLELRQRRMVYGDDYFDLATFHWESGDLEQALKVAEEGLRHGKGNLDDLRLLLSEHARQSGDRERYLTLQFEQALDHLTLASYKAFRKLCKKSEWQHFEPLLLEHLKSAWQSHQMEIYMHRQEPARAMAVLAEMSYPAGGWECESDLRVAQQLEPLFPEQILRFYTSGLGNLKESASRGEYARQAQVMAKIQRLLVEVIKDEPRWRKFVAPVKQNNLKRPAFQQEFAKAVPGWAAL